MTIKLIVAQTVMCRQSFNFLKPSATHNTPFQVTGLLVTTETQGGLRDLPWSLIMASY